MKPVVVGCRTENFMPEQLEVFARHQPAGMIVFAEPCRVGPDAVRDVVRQFKEAVPQGKIFIDAEGGRVNRLKPEFGHGWREVPAPRSFVELLEKDIAAGLVAIEENAALIGADLAALGIEVNCAPVVDLVAADVIAAVGDDGKPHATSASLYQRSFGNNPQLVADCGRAFLRGLARAGVVGVVKHVPGYGRVSADPHYAHSGISTPLSELQAHDFEAFRLLNDAPAMMTAHAIYQAIDDKNCATLSKPVLDMVRRDIGFKGVLIADTIEMNALWPEGFSKTARDQFGMGLPLAGTLATLTQRALTAGCDLVMHSDCSRDFAHTIEVLEAAPELSDTGADKIISCLSVAVV